MTVYMDAAATTPVLDEVAELVMRLMVTEFGNAGSRTHEIGAQAKRAVNKARDQLASVVGADPDSVVFTSGATESNNLAILGLEQHGRETGRRHVISTQIEHKAVLEPLQRLAGRGFDVELVAPDRDGCVQARDVLDRVRDDETLLVSVMAVNNETGAVQPVGEISAGLEGRTPFLHVDAAQAFAKDERHLSNPRIDLMSVSGHKLYAPKGIGALIVRKRGYKRVPLTPLMVGGGQERGIRPGTLPVPLIAGLGLSCQLAQQEAASRLRACIDLREQVLLSLRALGATVHGNPVSSVAHIASFCVPGLDSEALMVLWKDLVAVSNGSACTSASYSPSHVLEAMALDPDVIAGTVRMSWTHLTPLPDLNEMMERLRLAV